MYFQGHITALIVHLMNRVEFSVESKDSVSCDFLKHLTCLSLIVAD